MKKRHDGTVKFVKNSRFDCLVQQQPGLALELPSSSRRMGVAVVKVEWARRINGKYGHSSA